jgi:hypothetical protein
MWCTRVCFPAAIKAPDVLHVLTKDAPLRYRQCMCPHARSRLLAAVLMIRAGFVLNVVPTLRFVARGACQLPDYTFESQVLADLTACPSSTPAGA